MKSPLILVLLLILSSCNQVKVSPSEASVKAIKICETNALADSLSDPESIDELISFINALPKPLELECLVRAFKRPLYVNASSSKLSVQPAESPDSPRIFIFKGKLIISLVPSGEGSHILEFSEMTTSMRSIKGEIALPVHEEVSKVDPYTKINNDNQTTCSGCHRSELLESLVEGVPVYSSLALRPSIGRDVPLENLQEYYYQCEAITDNSKRCAVYKALFSGGGDIIAKSFPEEMSLLLDTFGN